MTNLTRKCRTVSDVNNVLAALGKSERLFKGQGYCYWAEGEAASWDKTSVYVYRLSDMTIAQWLADHAAKETHHNRFN